MADSNEFDNDDLVNLYFAFHNNFTRTEFEKIILQLGFNPENIIGDNFGFRDVIREFIIVLKRRRKLPLLIDVFEQSVLEFNWRKQPLPFNTRNPTDRRNESELFKILSTQFSLSDLHQLCFFLGVDYDNLPYNWPEEQETELMNKDEDLEQQRKEAKIRELFVFFSRRRWSVERIVVVIDYMKPNTFRLR